MNRLMHGALALLAVGALACRDDAGEHQILAAVTSGGTPMQVTHSFAMPLQARVATEMSGCDNSPGPFITLSGELAVAGLGSRFTFKNNQKGTHTRIEEGSVEVALVPAGQSVQIPKQPVRGGVGGNPFIWIKLDDGDGQDLTGEIFLGRCVQGATARVTADFERLASALANIAVEDCANSPGPHITLDGDMSVRAGLGATLIFRNNDNPVGGPHEANADAVVRVRLVPPDQVFTSPKQPVLGGVGGNPWIFFGFLSSQGAELHDPVLLGRCEQLSHA